MDVKSSDSTAPPAVQAKMDGDKAASAAGSTSGNEATASPPAAPTGKVMRKVIRKVIKKVVKPASGVDTAVTGAEPSAPPTDSSSQAPAEGVKYTDSYPSAPAAGKVSDQKSFSQLDSPLSSQARSQDSPVVSSNQQHSTPEPCISISDPPLLENTEQHSISTQRVASHSTEAAAASTPALESPQSDIHSAKREDLPDTSFAAPTPAELVQLQSMPAALSEAGDSDGKPAVQLVSAHPHPATASIDQTQPQTLPSASTFLQSQSSSHPSPSSSAIAAPVSIQAEAHPTDHSQHGSGGSAGDNGVCCGATQAAGTESVSESRAEEGRPDLADDMPPDQNGHPHRIAQRSGSDSNDEPSSVHRNGRDAESQPASSSTPSSPVSPPSNSPLLSQRQAQGTSNGGAFASLASDSAAARHFDADATTASAHSQHDLHSQSGSSSGSPECVGAAHLSQWEGPALGDLQAQVLELSQRVATREAQLLKQATQMSDLQQVGFRVHKSGYRCLTCSKWREMHRWGWTGCCGGHHVWWWFWGWLCEHTAHTQAGSISPHPRSPLSNHTYLRHTLLQEHQDAYGFRPLTMRGKVYHACSTAQSNNLLHFCVAAALRLF